MENQENQETQEPNEKPELTVEQKLQQIVIFPHNLLEVSEIPVKPMLDILELEVQGKGYWGEPVAEQVTIRQEIVKLNKIIEDTKSSLDISRQLHSKLANQVSDLTDYLDENWNSIDEEVREKLCDIFGIDEEVTKYVTIKIEGSVEVKAPRGYDWDSVYDDINYDLSLSYSGDLEEVGYGFDGTDFSAEAD
ncbi:MAG: hypothetical protein EBR82_26630 [Caulobacteraceae bacterium]|nr:hypothetical protein [Caulobacteraceae bacterium]